MATAIRPKSKKQWEEEVPDCIDSKGNLTGEFSQGLYLVAAGARIGWDKIPKRGLSITEQALIATFRNAVDSMEKEYGIIGGLLAQKGMLNSEIQALTPGQTQILISLGRTFLTYAYIAKANPEVGHFIGSGNEQNQKDADNFLQGS